MKQVQPLNAEEEFLRRVENEIGDSALLQELHDFHGYLRDSGIGSGTIIGYLRKMYRNLDEDGELKATADEDCSAVKKYREYREQLVDCPHCDSALGSPEGWEDHFEDEHPEKVVDHEDLFEDSIEESTGESDE